MSNALDALMGLTDDQVAAYTADPETEGHIVIGPDRRITVPESLKRIAVQNDHNVETVTFDCPRHWDGHDLSQMHVYINYRLADGTLDSYPADNVVATGDVMNFDWTIKENATRLKGSITFLVCAKKTDSEGNLVNHWNSELCSDMSVSEGLECVEQIAEENKDLITHLLTRMDVVEQINVQADEMKTLRDDAVSAAEEAEAAKNAATEVQTKVEESAEEIRNLYSNAIVGTASGEAIRVDDVSPIEHAVKVKVRSKNLLSYPYYPSTVERHGVSIVCNDDGSITINGTSTASWNVGLVGSELDTMTLPAGTYTFSLKNGSKDSCYLVVGGNGSNVEYSFGTEVTFTLEEESSIGYCLVQIVGGVTFDNLTVYPQLEIGDTATEFTPYVDVATEEIVVTTCGKNMFDSSKLLTVSGWTEENGVYSGYAFPVHDKYNHTINSPLVTGFKANTRYVMTCKAYVEIQNGAEEQTGLVLQFKYSDGALSSMYIKHPVETEYTIISTPGKTVIGVFATYGSSIMTHIRDIQVEEGDTSTAYEPYTGSTDNISVSPTMTVMSNAPGTILDIEYNKDINTVFDEINSLLELLLNGGA